MCGFAGYLPSLGKKIDEAYINKMLKRTQYRGPDNTSIYCDQKIALGHHRLSVIDLQGGNQPVIDKETNNCLVFNGEIYGFKRHAKHLRELGLSLSDFSDTAVLFKLLNHYGVEKTLKKIDGMFSFAYFVKQKNSLYLVRDRSGEKPLYFGKYKNHIIFGSEIKTITDFPFFKKSINFSSISEYLQLDYISQDNTLFNEIKKVKAGQYIKFCNNKLTAHTYWKLNNENKQNISEKDALNKLENMIETSVRDRLVSDVPLGLFLSGGIDSSIIAYYSKKYSPHIQAFTIKFNNKSYDESSYADIVAKHLNIINHSILLSENDLINSLSIIEKKLDEPISDPSIIPTYLVCKLAKKKVTVALSGDGADELFSGYAPFKYIFLMRFFSLLPRFFGKSIYELFNFIPYRDNYMSLLFLIKQISKGIGYNTNQQIFRWMSSFTKTDLEKLFLKNIKEKILQNEEIINCLTEKFYNNKISLHDQITQMFFENYLPNNILTKVDRASMYNSLEVRTPFLQKNIIEFSSSLNASYKIRGKTKLLLRKLCEGKLPMEIISRKKHGFAIPLANMIRTSLKEKVTDTLTSNNNISEFIDKKYVSTIIQKHQKGIDFRKQIWSLYILEKTLENYK